MTTSSSGDSDGPFDFTVDDRLRLWPERRDRWVYARVPDRLTERLDGVLAAHPRGFRSVHVSVRAGDEEWSSGLFRYQDGSWALPVRADLRTRLGVDVDDMVHLVVHVPSPTTSGSPPEEAQAGPTGGTP